MAQRKVRKPKLPMVAEPDLFVSAGQAAILLEVWPYTIYRWVELPEGDPNKLRVARDVVGSVAISLRDIVRRRKEEGITNIPGKVNGRVREFLEKLGGG